MFRYQKLKVLWVLFFVMAHILSSVSPALAGQVSIEEIAQARALRATLLHSQASQLDADWVRAAEQRYFSADPGNSDLNARAAAIRKIRDDYKDNGVFTDFSWLSKYLFHIDVFLHLTVNGFNIAAMKEWRVIAETESATIKSLNLSGESRQNFQNIFESISLDTFVLTYQNLGDLSQSQKSRLEVRLKGIIAGGKKEELAMSAESITWLVVSYFAFLMGGIEEFRVSNWFSGSVVAAVVVVAGLNMYRLSQPLVLDYREFYKATEFPRYISSCQALLKLSVAPPESVLR